MPRLSNKIVTVHKIESDDFFGRSTRSHTHIRIRFAALLRHGIKIPNLASPFPTELIGRAKHSPV